MPSPRGSSQPRDRTHVSCSPCIAGRFFTAEPAGTPSHQADVQLNSPGAAAPDHLVSPGRLLIAWPSSACPFPSLSLSQFDVCVCVRVRGSERRSDEGQASLPFSCPTACSSGQTLKLPSFFWSCLRVDLGQGLQELSRGRREKEATSNSDPVCLPIHFSPLYSDSWASCQLLQRKGPDVAAKGRP